MQTRNAPSPCPVVYAAALSQTHAVRRSHADRTSHIDQAGNSHRALCDLQIGFLGPAFFLTQLSHVTTPLAAVACMMASQGLDAFSQSGLYSNHQAGLPNLDLNPNPNLNLDLKTDLRPKPRPYLDPNTNSQPNPDPARSSGSREATTLCLDLTQASLHI